MTVFKLSGAKNYKTILNHSNLIVATEIQYHQNIKLQSDKSEVVYNKMCVRL